MACAASIKDDDCRCPDDTVGTKMWLVLTTPQAQAYCDEMIIYKASYSSVGIRHGIQCKATRSVILTKINHNKAT